MIVTMQVQGQILKTSYLLKIRLRNLCLVKDLKEIMMQQFSYNDMGKRKKAQISLVDFRALGYTLSYLSTSIGRMLSR